MKPLKPKYKIYNQTQENINDIKTPQKLKNKKWKRFLLQFDGPNENKRTFNKSQSLKHLYKQRLLERQKFKMFYGLLNNRKLKKCYSKIKTKHSISLIDNLVINLETRLDLILWRSKLFKSIFEIHQIINHGFIKINNKVLTKKNITVKLGDYIWIDPAVQRFTNKDIILPSYLEWNDKLNILVLVRKPEMSDIQHSFKFNPVLIFNYLNNK